MRHARQSERLLPGPSHSRMPASEGGKGRKGPRWAGVLLSPQHPHPISVSSPAGNPCQEHTGPHMHTHTQMHTRICTDTHTHTHMHTHHTHTDTHAHIPTYAYRNVPTHSHIPVACCVLTATQNPQPARVQEGSRGKEGRIYPPVQPQGPRRGSPYTRPFEIQRPE